MKVHGRQVGNSWKSVNGDNMEVRRHKSAEVDNMETHLMLLEKSLWRLVQINGNR